LNNTYNKKNTNTGRGMAQLLCICICFAFGFWFRFRLRLLLQLQLGLRRIPSREPLRKLTGGRKAESLTSGLSHKTNRKIATHRAVDPDKIWYWNIQYGCNK